MQIKFLQTSTAIACLAGMSVGILELAGNTVNAMSEFEIEQAVRRGITTAHRELEAKKADDDRIAWERRQAEARRLERTASNAYHKHQNDQARDHYFSRFGLLDEEDRRLLNERDAEENMLGFFGKDYYTNPHNKNHASEKKFYDMKTDRLIEYCNNKQKIAADVQNMKQIRLEREATRQERARREAENRKVAEEQRLLKRNCLEVTYEDTIPACGRTCSRMLKSICCVLTCGLCCRPYVYARIE